MKQQLFNLFNYAVHAFIIVALTTYLDDIEGIGYFFIKLVVIVTTLRLLLILLRDIQ